MQSAIIPLVGQWMNEFPGTISLGQGVIFYLPPSEVGLVLQATQLIANKKPP